MNRNEAFKLDNYDYYVGVEEISNSYGIFGSVSGFCYAAFSDLEDAEKNLLCMKLEEND